MTTPAGSARPPQPRRHGSWFARVLIALLAVVVLLAVVDQVAKTVVQHRLAGRIRSSQHLSARPDVTIHGWPFLTQVAAGRYGHVSVRTRSPITEQGVQLTDAKIDLHGVDVTASDAMRGTVKTLPVKSGSGSAFISYAAVTSVLTNKLGGLGTLVTVTGGSAGHAVIAGPLGLSLTVSARVADGKLQIVADPADLDDLPALIRPAITAALADPIPLPPFPFNVTLSSAQLEPAGVHLYAVAHNSTFPI